MNIWIRIKNYKSEHVKFYITMYREFLKFFFFFWGHCICNCNQVGCKLQRNPAFQYKKKNIHCICRSHQIIIPFLWTNNNQKLSGYQNYFSLFLSLNAVTKSHLWSLFFSFFFLRIPSCYLYGGPSREEGMHHHHPLLTIFPYIPQKQGINIFIPWCPILEDHLSLKTDFWIVVLWPSRSQNFLRN